MSKKDDTYNILVLSCSLLKSPLKCFDNQLLKAKRERFGDVIFCLFINFLPKEVYMICLFQLLVLSIVFWKLLSADPEQMHDLSKLFPETSFLMFIICGGICIYTSLVIWSFLPSHYNSLALLLKISYKN